MNTNDLFDVLFGNNTERTVFGNDVMRSDILEEGDAYIVNIEMPGFTKENINVSFDNDILKVEGERLKKDNIDYIRSERSFGKFERSFYFKESVEENDIRAKYDNGVLTIVIAKKKNNGKKLINLE